MDSINPEKLQSKLQISEAAARIYVEQNARFSLHDVGRQTDKNVAQILEYFSSKREILEFYYESLVIRYRLMIDEINDFGSYSLSEKFSNFAYASFDMMEEQQAFIEQTFRSHIIRRCGKTAYENEVQELFEDFFAHDNGKSASSDLFVNEASLRLMARQYLQLVTVWIDDKSEGKEKTLELTDKLTGLLEEIVYTSVIDRSLDIAKFLYSNNIFKERCPAWRKLTSTFDLQ